MTRFNMLNGLRLPFRQSREPRPLRGWILLVMLLLSATPLRADDGATARQVDVAGDASAVEIARRYPSSVVFDVYREGDRVGSHRLNFEISGEDLTVQVSSRLTVTILRVPVFKFRYSSTEQWQGAALQSIRSSKRENRKRQQVSLDNLDDISILESPDGRIEVPRLDYGTNHWNIAAVGESRLFNTLNGDADRVTVDTLGRERVPVGTVDVQATHYRYRGGFDADVWYDDKGRWVRLEFDADDGSRIVYAVRPFAR